MTQSNTPFPQRAWEAYAVVFFLIFLPAIWLLIGYGELSTERAHKAFLAQLNGLSTAFILDLNGRKVEEADRIVSDLKRVKLYRGEHAPGRKPKWYQIEIRDDRRTLRLFLAKSDIVTDKYWVSCQRATWTPSRLQIHRSGPESEVLSTRSWQSFSPSTSDSRSMCDRWPCPAGQSAARLIVVALGGWEKREGETRRVGTRRAVSAVLKRVFD